MRGIYSYIDGQTIEARVFQDRVGNWRFRVVRVRPDANATADTLAVSSIEDKYDTAQEAVDVVELLRGHVDRIRIVE